MDLRRPLRALCGAELQVLLPRPGVPHAVRSGKRGYRAVLRAAPPKALVPACLRVGVIDKRRPGRSDYGRAGPTRRDACENHGALGGDAGIEVETREAAELPQTFADV